MVIFFLTYCYGPNSPATHAELVGAYTGKGVVLCGASYGIGAEIAYRLAKHGAKLVLSARSEPLLLEVAERCRQLGASEVTVHAADLSTREGAKGLIDRAETVFKGPIDVLILNHIIGFYDDWAQRITQAHHDNTLEKELSFVDKIFAVNTLSYIYLSSYALHQLAETSGRIVVVGSAAGKQGLPRVAPYAASKHAVFGYFDSLRQDLMASQDPQLRAISITTGILGAFDTETAREGTKGLLDHMPWSPPGMAADALIMAGARRLREVYVPWEQTRIVTLLHPLAPELMDWVIRKITLPEN